MKINYLKICLLAAITFITNSFSQQTLPVYTDYLSDNVYLLHPSAAGIGNTSKLRLTARQQWAGVENSPALQTVSFHSRFGEESNAGFGLIFFNDRNGYHSQQGAQGAYSYHLRLSNGKIFDQLSFGLAFSFVQNQADQTSFVTFDPAVDQIIQSNAYYNADFSLAYHRGGLSTYFTARNLFLSAKNHLNAFEPLDLRNYVFYGGYYFGEDKRIQFEPSIMAQFKPSLGERIVDVNFKAYKKIRDTLFWAALSYRSNFDENPIENPSYVAPIIGVNYQKFMFSYAYTQQINDVVLTSGGFHQITLGLDLFERVPRGSACPNINSSFGSF